MHKVLGLALYGSMAASHRVRLGQYVEGLQQSGIQLEIQSLLNNDYLQRRFSNQSISLSKITSQFATRIYSLASSTKYSGLVVQGELLPFFPAWIELKFLIRPYIYDFDDAFFLKYREGHYKNFAPFLGAKFDSMMKRANKVFAGSRVLHDYAVKQNPSSFLIPSAVDTTVYCPASNAVRTNFFTVGWIGSPSTSAYLQQLVEPLTRLSKVISLRFIVVGGKAPAMPGIDVVQLPWEQANEINLLRSFDVGVMPLTDDPWSRGKCAFKLIQYMACRIPVVASPVGANLDVVTPECGFLAKDSYEWFAALEVLYRLPELRLKMGCAGRERIISDFSLEKNLPRIRDHLHELTS